MSDTYSGNMHVINENTNNLDELKIESITMGELLSLLNECKKIDLIVFNIGIMLDEEVKK